MPALIVPLLAQLITVGVTDRTEARYLEPYPYHYEASTKPAVRLNLAWPRYDLSFGYGANLTLGPLESTPRDLLVYHSAFASTTYRLRRTSITLAGYGSLGEVNFLVQTLRDPAAPRPSASGQDTGGASQGGKPTQPSPSPTTPEAQPQTSIANSAVRYGTWNASIAVGHQLNRDVTLTALAVHTVAGGLDDAARVNYPVTRGTVVGVAGSYVLRWSAQDTFGSSGVLQQAWSSLGTRVTSVYATETWTHRFAKRTSSTLGAGLSMTRTPLYEVYTAYSVYPTFSAGFAHETLLARGFFTLGLGAYSAPALDPLRATVDPRIGTTASLGWTRDRFAARISGGAAISIAPRGNDAGAFSNTQGSAVMSYRLADWLSADVGGRLARQSYQDTVTVPLSYALFAGLTFDTVVPLYGAK